MLISRKSIRVTKQQAIQAITIFFQGTPILFEKIIGRKTTAIQTWLFDKTFSQK